jgi:hypothetical protein
MKDLEFIVLTCDKYLSTRVEAIKNTWGKGQNIKFLSDSKSENKQILGYDTPQSYDGIYLKYLHFFKSYDFHKKNYFFFIDDDTFVNLNNLKDLQLPTSDKLFAICRLLCLNNDGTDLYGNQTGTNLNLISGENTNLPLYYPSGGSGFILSKSACIAIQNYLNLTTNTPQSIFSDVSLGFWARNCNVEIIPNANFWWDIHERLLQNNVEKYESDENVVTFHYVNELQMSIYHEKYNKHHEI